MPESRLAVQWKALDPHVIAVAVQRIEGAWCAYIGSVPGQSHASEWLEVRDGGTKLPHRIASAIFPSYPFDELPYAD